MLVDQYGLSVATSDCLYEWIIDSFPQPIHLSDLVVILEHTRWIICSTDSFEDTDCSATNHSESFNKTTRSITLIHSGTLLLCIDLRPATFNSPVALFETVAFFAMLCLKSKWLNINLMFIGLLYKSNINIMFMTESQLLIVWYYLNVFHQ